MHKNISVFTLYLFTIASFSCDVEAASSASSCPFIPMELYGRPEVYTTSSAYGGVLCKNVYVFHKIRFYVNSNLKGRSNDLVDGVGTCLTLSIIYYNSKYPSFNESLNHRDGVAIVNFQLTTGPVTNLLFIPVGPLIRLLREPGSQFYLTPVALVYAWAYELPKISKYYAYPGSYLDLETGKHYECAMVIVADGQYPELTALQYEAFLSLKSIDGSSLETVSPKVYPAGKRAVYKALGVHGQFAPL